MNFSIDLAKIRKKKLFIATPMYGGQCTGQYCSSLVKLAGRIKEFQFHMEHFFIFNESLITRARSYCVDEFLRSDCTHLLFIDADIGFIPDDVIIMLNMMDHDSPYDVLAAPYPKKVISWENIVIATNKGLAAKNPSNLENYVGDYVLNLPEGVTTIAMDAPFEVAGAGTGFMMIRRETFERVQAATPDLSFTPDHKRNDHFDGARPVHLFFDCEIDPVSRRYLSEDYFFCRNVRNAGMQVWMTPHFELSHTGTYTFRGSLQHLALLGTTADGEAEPHAQTLRP